MVAPFDCFDAEFREGAGRLSTLEFQREDLVPIESLRPTDHGPILCYPGTDLSSFEDRVQQLKEMGVHELILEGPSKVGKYGIAGRGCVSIVVKSRMESNPLPVALKIRRIDANRPDMARDYRLQKFANSFGVGPLAIAATRDFFAMEFIDSIKIGNWLRGLKTRSSKKSSRRLVRHILLQCHLLDLNGLDHGELSNPSKHILIKGEKSVIIDFESASTDRRVSNLSAVGAFLFLGGWQSEKLKRVLRPSGKSVPSRAKLISLFGEYKKRPDSSSFEKILSHLHV